MKNTVVRQGQAAARNLGEGPWLRGLGEMGLYLVTGFFFSAAALGGGSLGLVPGILCTLQGIPAALFAAGGLVGYRFFWGESGQAVLWIFLSLGVGLTLSGRAWVRNAPLLLPAIAGLILSASGVLFQSFFRDDTSVLLYFLRVATAAISAALARESARCRTPITTCLVGAFLTLALAQVWLPGDICLGLICAGFLGVQESFPAAVLSGVALDLSQAVNVPMGAVMCLGFSLRLLPERLRYGRCLGSAAAFCFVSGLLGRFSLLPGVTLALGGLASLVLPYTTPVQKRLGKTGKVQVQLELAAGVLKRSQELICQYRPPTVDVRGLLDQTVARACAHCPNRKTCRQELSLPETILKQESPGIEDIPCRKPGRVLQELQYTQSQYRTALGEARRKQNLIAAVGQQYAFLSDYLQILSDGFGDIVGKGQRFTPETAACSAGHQSINGDAGLMFSGTGHRFYMLLCDGMGTGSLAAKESRESAAMLKRLLCSGYPVEQAMKSLNSLCYLRGCSGIVTADLAEISLETGKTALYKWGACPSYLIRGREVMTLGGSTTPVGLSPQKDPEITGSLYLHSGDTLVLVSDGVGSLPELPPGNLSPGEIAAALLGGRDPGLRDDATVLVMRLNRV